MSDSVRPYGLETARLFSSWDFPDKKNTGMGCHFLLQGIFLTQESNLDLLDCRQFFTKWATGDRINKATISYAGLRENKHLFLLG